MLLLDRPGDHHIVLGRLAEDLGFSTCSIHSASDDEDLVRLPQIARGCIDAWKHDDLDTALDVFEVYESHRVSLFGDVRANPLHDASNDHGLTVHLFGDLAAETRNRVLQIDGDLVQWVLGDVKADQLFLPVQHLFARDRSLFRKYNAALAVSVLVAQHVKHHQLAHFLCLVNLSADGQHLVQGG